MVEYLIQNARIADGSGKPWVYGDVAVDHGKIVAVGFLKDVSARHRIQADRRWLTPGFIDIHRHGDVAMFRPSYGQAELRQGLTSVINGNCGLSVAPVDGPHQQDVRNYLTPITGTLPEGFCSQSMGEYLEQVEKHGSLIHNGMLAGMGTLRACVAGFTAGDLDRQQLRCLHAKLERALGEGALGVSLGIGYAPECFYSTEGLIQALEPLKGSDVPVTVHMRQEGDGVQTALKEMLFVADTLQLNLEVSHLKAIGTKNWRKCVPEMLQEIRKARERGVRVSCDVYPYTAGSTQLIHVLPPEVQEGGTEVLTNLLKDKKARERMIQRIQTGSDFENIIHLVGFEHIIATGLQVLPEMEGKSLQEIARLQNKNPFDALFDLLEAEHCKASMIDFITAEEDIEEILAQPFSGVISDATYPVEGLCHPRVYGTYARFLQRFVREKHLMSVEQAIHKITQKPAELFGLPNKGRIKVGADADLCIFDLDCVKENGTWSQPEKEAEGMDWVFVGGQPAIANRKIQSKTHGEILKQNS